MQTGTYKGRTIWFWGGVVKLGKKISSSLRRKKKYRTILQTEYSKKKISKFVKISYAAFFKKVYLACTPLLKKFLFLINQMARPLAILNRLLSLLLKHFCHKNQVQKLCLTFSPSSTQFWAGFIPVNGGGRIYSTLIAISPTPTLHLTRFKASSFSKPTLLLALSTCIFHVFLGRPRHLLPFTLQKLQLPKEMGF